MELEDKTIHDLYLAYISIIRCIWYKNLKLSLKSLKKRKKWKTQTIYQQSRAEAWGLK